MGRYESATGPPAAGYVSLDSVGEGSEVEEVGPPAPVPNPKRFFNDDYAPILREIVSDIVRHEGPIRDHLLYRAVSRAHGWQRAGRRIRERVEACLGRNEVHEEHGSAFICAPGTHASRTKFRHSHERSARDISRAEIAGLIAEHPELGKTDEPARDLARPMGIARLTEDTRNYLEDCVLKSLAERESAAERGNAR